MTPREYADLADAVTFLQIGAGLIGAALIYAWCSYRQWKADRSEQEQSR